MNYIKLGIELKHAREAAGFTQKQIAESLNVTAQTLSAWENGKNKIDIDTFAELCIRYNVDFVETLNMLREDEISLNIGQKQIYKTEVRYSKISGVLKAARIKAEYTVKEVSEHLVSLGYKASVKTIYSWETGHSQPTPDALFELCKFYRVFNIPREFEFQDAQEPTDKANTLVSSIPLSKDAIKVAQNYDSADQHIKDSVRVLLGITEAVDSPRENNEQKEKMA